MIEVQKAVYNALTSYAPLTAITSNIFDISVQGSAYPYVIIGEDDHQEWNTDDRNGSEVMVTIHTWSVQRGRSETKNIQKKIYDALHLQNLSVTGYQFIVCYFVSETTIMDPDGLATHGISKFKITIAG